MFSQNFCDRIVNEDKWQKPYITQNLNLIVSLSQCIKNGLIFLRVFLHKEYTESIKLLDFDKNC